MLFLLCLVFTEKFAPSLSIQILIISNYSLRVTLIIHSGFLIPYQNMYNILLTCFILIHIDTYCYTKIWRSGAPYST